MTAGVQEKMSQENSALQSTAEFPAFPVTLDEISQGMEADQFVPFYQPKVTLQGMKLVGVEALIRWKHPIRGLIPAGVFLPMLRDSFLFDELTLLVLDKSIAQCRRWRDHGLDVPVSVNLSPELLTDPGFADRVDAKVHDHELPPDKLVIEVSEAAVAQYITNALDSFVQLRMKGFGLAIDDYGTGHCARAQLERIPASEMKIDRKMLAGAARGGPLKEKLKQSVDVARELGFKSVAEGIENQDEWDVVNELGCDMAQGYFIARPMAGEALPEWHQFWSVDPFL